MRPTKVGDLLRLKLREQQQPATVKLGAVRACAFPLLPEFGFDF